METRNTLARIAPCTLVLLALAGPGCGRSRPARTMRSAPLAVQVYADAGRGMRLPVRGPGARAWLARVSPERPAPVTPAPAPPAPAPPAPEPGGMPPAAEPGPALEVDPGLKPPVLRGPAVLDMPVQWRQGSLELDVHVDEHGEVDRALPATAGADSALVAAARRCALRMRFYPALRSGRPVAVWCRQRFDFGGGR
jgi:hypothetical protein